VVGEEVGGEWRTVPDWAGRIADRYMIFI